MVVAEKWTGTESDRQDMKKLQLEQVVRRNFGSVTMFGFSTTLICSWEVILASLAISLSNGGTAGLFWGYIVSVFGLTFTYLSISEMGSMFPTSGGQYYWVSVIAPRFCHKYLSYLTGWICVVQWQSGIAGASYLAGTIIQALFVLNIPDYDYQRWHGSLLALGITLVALIFNTALARKLPIVEGILVFVHVLGVLVLVPVWALSPIRKGGSPLTEFYNPNGWSSFGVATWVGMLSTSSSLIGFDCNVHMAEETKNSSRTVPFILIAGYATNALLGFFVVITCIYTIGPLEQTLLSPSGYPFVDMFFAATKSYAATIIMVLLIVLCWIASGIAVLATASRQLWAFARSNGVPFSKALAPGPLKFDIPIKALLVSLTVTVVLVLINIGSSEALTAVLAIGNSSLISSYTIIIVCSLIHRLRGLPLPRAEFTLGKWGILVNVLALSFLLPMFVFSAFPPAPKPTAMTLNWGPVVYGAVIIFGTFYYILVGRFVYKAPQLDLVNNIVIVDDASETKEGASFEKEQAINVQAEVA